MHANRAEKARFTECHVKFELEISTKGGLAHETGPTRRSTAEAI